MQTKAGIGAKTNDAAGIRRDWFEEYDVKHDAPNAGQNSRNLPLTRRVQAASLLLIDASAAGKPPSSRTVRIAITDFKHGFRAGQGHGDFHLLSIRSSRLATIAFLPSPAREIGPTQQYGIGPNAPRTTSSPLRIPLSARMAISPSPHRQWRAGRGRDRARHRAGGRRDSTPHTVMPPKRTASRASSDRGSLDHHWAVP